MERLVNDVESVIARQRELDTIEGTGIEARVSGIGSVGEEAAKIIAALRDSEYSNRTVQGIKLEMRVSRLKNSRHSRFAQEQWPCQQGNISRIKRLNYRY